MRIRKSSRLLVLNESHQILLFQFTHTNDALAGQSYWATVGGGLEEGETFEQAAYRELYEELGVVRQNVGTHVATRNFEMMLPSAEIVISDERLFIVFIKNEEVNTANWTEQEKLVISKSRWWTFDELSQTDEIVYPNNIPNILIDSLPEIFKP
ncbi:NUDIX domain-containing protein [Acinetobacter baumannii]|nr:NUDIX domain-containing protein [Acinetobacter baumannii]KAB1609061.1 NUDIX domain-containing protein [Acinetobacter baumannii]MBP4063154.1 NUDIX domain-containing protein [Acinetobacter baumannii]MDC4374193.1 NUDIX domain-containing protein [Acinetobacter baumannii]MDH2549078.1 NUDIX domain-containing protein [Acinetobacter baumannii]MDH2643840.1 NUDIX domain-containing protein [Acinetobacter baumannii]